VDSTARREAAVSEHRRFTNTTTRNAFWEVWVEGRTHYVQFGPIGTAGQVRSKIHGSPQAAHAAVGKLIRKKLDKGYVEEVTRRRVDSAKAKPKPAPKAQRDVEPDGFLSPRRALPTQPKPRVR
jgi:predicted DNA-binding WGR domain protein